MKYLRMLISQICDVKDNEIVIHLPDTFSHGKKVRVTIDNIVTSKEEKMALIKLSATDPLFQADVREASDDFNTIDQESL